MIKKSDKDFGRMSKWLGQNNLVWISKMNGDQVIKRKPSDILGFTRKK